MLQTSFATLMSTLLLLPISSNFIVASFLKAARVTKFKQQWMMAGTWAELINRHFKIEEQHLNITGNDIVKAVRKPAHSNVSLPMDVDQQNVPWDHIGVFHDMYWLHTSNKCIHCSSCLKSSVSYNINVSASLSLTAVSFMYLQQYLLISCK